MKPCDYENLLLKSEKDYKKFLTIELIFAIIFIGLFIAGLLISTYENKSLIMVIFSLILSLIAIIIAAFFIFGVAYNNSRIKTFRNILNGYLINISGEIVDISTSLKTILKRRVYEISIKSNEDIVIVYYDSEFSKFNFQKGDLVIIKTSNSFITSIEKND